MRACSGSGRSFVSSVTKTGSPLSLPRAVELEELVDRRLGAESDEARDLLGRAAEPGAVQEVLGVGGREPAAPAPAARNGEEERDATPASAFEGVLDLISVTS